MAVFTTRASLVHALAMACRLGPRLPSIILRPTRQTVVDTLIPAGLDGYMVDPESETGRPWDDWNNDEPAPLAQAFVPGSRISAAAGLMANPRFGTTWPQLSQSE